MNENLLAAIDELTKRMARGQSDEELQRVLKDVVKEAMHEFKAEQHPERSADWRGLSGKVALLATGIAIGRRFASQEAGREGTQLDITDETSDEGSDYEDLSDVGGATEAGSESGGRSLLLPLVLVTGVVSYLMYRRRSEGSAPTLDDLEESLSGSSESDGGHESGLAQDADEDEETPVDDAESEAEEEEEE